MGVERNVCWQASTSRRFTVVNAVCEGQGDSLRKPRGWARMGRRVDGRWALGAGRWAAEPGGRGGGGERQRALALTPALTSPGQAQDCE